MKFSISSIELTNYRQYIGTQEISFKVDDSKNVAVICGLNGSGKSNLLNALTWCLYGIEMHGLRYANEMEGLPVVNSTVVKSLESNQRAHAEVKVHLETDIGPWTITRKVEGWKNESGKFSSEESDLTVIWPLEDQDKVVSGDGTQALINTLLPKDLKGFFFIDGEQLHNFFRESTPALLSEAIDTVSQLDLVNKALDHLRSLDKELLKQIKKTTPKIEKLKSTIQYVESDVEIRKESIEKYKREKLKADSALIKVKDFLKNNSVENIRVLETERQLLEAEIKDDKNPRLRSLESKREAYLVDIAPFIYLKKPIEYTYSLINDKVAKGELPSKIKATFVRELLEEGRCICGNDLSGVARATLEEFANLQSLSELSDVAFSGKTTISDILSSINEFPSVMDEMSVEIDALKSEIDKKKGRTQDISDQIKDSPIEKIKICEDRRDQLLKTSHRRGRDIELLTDQVERALSKKQGLEKELENELRKRKEGLVLSEKLNLVTESEKVLRETIDKTKTGIRKQVEASTKANFLKLLRKKETFKDVVIDEGYAVSVVHESGYNALNDLSAGEYLVLGLSFMSALVSVSGFQPPVIIDTPLGKLDPEHKDHITAMLPQFLAGTQLILLVTPSEYCGDNQVAKKNLAQFLIPSNYYGIGGKEDEAEITQDFPCCPPEMCPSPCCESKSLHSAFK